MAVDLLRPGLNLLFCGYNPSLTSGQTGHHYAHPGNRFWRVLYAARITDRLYAPEEDTELLDLGIGFTNLCPRPTRRADELTREEIRAGAEALRATLERYRPRAVAYTGIGVYKWFRATSKATWGVQPASAVPGVTDVVVPSPSGLNRMRFEELADHYRVLGALLREQEKARVGAQDGQGGGRYREEAIPDCGHTPHVDKPEEFRHLLFGFIEER